MKILFKFGNFPNERLDKPTLEQKRFAHSAIYVRSLLFQGLSALQTTASTGNFNCRFAVVCCFISPFAISNLLRNFRQTVSFQLLHFDQQMIGFTAVSTHHSGLIQWPFLSNSAATQSSFSFLPRNKATFILHIKALIL